MRKAQPLGPAEHALMGLLHLEPRHGYELAEWFEPDGELGEVCTIHQSLLYAQLKRLELLGYVSQSTETVGGRPPRHVYSLTDAGEEEFWRWLNAPVHRNREIRMDFLLKIYFSEKIGGHGTAHLVSRQLAIAGEELADQERELERYSEGSFPRLLRQMRLVATRGTIRWLEDFHGELALRRQAPRDRSPESNESAETTRLQGTLTTVPREAPPINPQV